VQIFSQNPAKSMTGKC